MNDNDKNGPCITAVQFINRRVIALRSGADWVVAISTKPQTEQRSVKYFTIEPQPKMA